MGVVGGAGGELLRPLEDCETARRDAWRLEQESSRVVESSSAVVMSEVRESSESAKNEEE